MSAPKDSKNYYEWKRKIKIKFNTQEYKEKQRLAHLGKKNNKLSETLKMLYKEGKIKPWDKGIKRPEFSGKNNPMNIPDVRKKHLQTIKNPNAQKKHLEAVKNTIFLLIMLVMEKS